MTYCWAQTTLHMEVNVPWKLGSFQAVHEDLLRENGEEPAEHMNRHVPGTV